MNPFRKSPAALRPMDPNDLEIWIRPEEAWKLLKHSVDKKENLVILGVEGSGKSTLLNMFFSPAYCREAAQSYKLIFTANLSDTKDGDGLCNYLIDQLLETAEDLLPDPVNKKLERTLADAKEKSPKQTFNDLCKCLYNCGYTILMVQDGFEHFVSSPNITQDQHDMLRSLLDEDIMRCIVATNYDLERSSLPKDVQGSLYLQKFQQKLTLQGFSRAEATSFLQNYLSGDEIQFNEKQIGFLLDYTGCIPGLLETSASHMYDMVQERGQVHVETFTNLLQNETRVTLQRWCKYFPQVYDELVESICPSLANAKALVTLKPPHSNTQQCNAAVRLFNRGLWRKAEEETYRFNSMLLQNFFSNGEYVPCPLEEPEQAAPSVVNYINVTNHNETYNQQTYHNQIVNLIAPTQELLDMLTSAGSGRESLATALRDSFLSKLPQDGLQNIQRLEGMSDAEYDALCDQEFSRQYSDKVVDALPADEEDELTSITQEQQLSLDQRFQEARRYTRPELTDALLEKVSPRTGFYLKLSVVVEDALSTLRLMPKGDQEAVDCSPQLILYGKAVEQQLKDSFFPLFNREENLKTYQIKTEGRGLLPFAQVDEGRTSIGNYMHAIGDNVSRLCLLCSSHGLSYQNNILSQAQWQIFWRTLRRNIDDARSLRNLSAHTSRTRFPRWEDVDRIAALSFGMADGSSIFESCAVCNDLNISLFGKGPLSIGQGKELEGQEKVICCTRLTSRNGIHGRLEDQDCIVKISPVMAQQFRSANPNVSVEPQKKYRVRLMEYKEQNGELFFSAEMLAPV